MTTLPTDACTVDTVSGDAEQQIHLLESGWYIRWAQDSCLPPHKQGVNYV